MTIGERIRKIRHELNLTQAAFAARIGSVQNSVTGYENGRRNPSQPVITLICSEFNVREEWLRFGEGPMFAPAPSSALDALAAERHLSHGDYVFIEKLLEMPPEKRRAAMEFMVEFARDILDGGVALDAPALGDGAVDVAGAEALYEKSLGIAPSTASTASNTTGGTASQSDEKTG